MREVFDFEADLWEYPGDAPWVFVTLPIDQADEIDDGVLFKKGFGSVRISVTIGSST